MASTGRDLHLIAGRDFDAQGLCRLPDVLAEGDVIIESPTPVRIARRLRAGGRLVCSTDLAIGTGQGTGLECRGDVEIAGSLRAGNAPVLGGDVRVKGDLHVTGYATVTGAVRVGGKLMNEIGFLGSGGDIEVGGDLVTWRNPHEEMDYFGSFQSGGAIRIGGMAWVSKIECEGDLVVGRGVGCAYCLTTDGLLRVQGDVRAVGRIHADAIDVTGDLSASELSTCGDVRVGGSLRVGPLGTVVGGDLDVAGACEVAWGSQVIGEVLGTPPTVGT